MTMYVHEHAKFYFTLETREDSAMVMMGTEYSILQQAH